MNHDLYSKYRDMFNCIIGMNEPGGGLSLFVKDEEGLYTEYDINEYSEQEINFYIKQSIETGNNVLFEKCKMNKIERIQYEKNNIIY